MRRNWRGDQSALRLVLRQLKRDRDNVDQCDGLDNLLGIEGAAAGQYFGAFNSLLKEDIARSFDFTHRNRRPPRDPVNALLSFAYSMLVRIWTHTLASVGFDPYRGFYHQPRYGRPALALDMMEAFRPLLADSAVIQAINNGEVKSRDFVITPTGTALTPKGKKRFIATVERRLQQEIIHPLFGYRVSYRRLFEIQARLLARHLLGELKQYPEFTTR